MSLRPRRRIAYYDGGREPSVEALAAGTDPPPEERRDG